MNITTTATASVRPLNSTESFTERDFTFVIDDRKLKTHAEAKKTLTQYITDYGYEVEEVSRYNIRRD